MNKERLQAIIDRIEADLDGWDQKFWDSANTPRLAFFAQIDAGLELHIFNARRDARIWLDLSNKQADYLLSNLRTVVEIKRFLKHYIYDLDGIIYDGLGYDQHGYNQAGYDQAGYDRDGLDHNNKPKPEQV